MEFILFNVEDDLKKSKIVRHEVKENCFITEVVLTGVKQRLERGSGIINKLKNTLYDKRLRKLIKQALDGNLTKWYYVLNNSIKDKSQIKYLSVEFQKMLGYEFIHTSEMKENITKYIAEYVNKNNIKNEQIKLLVVHNKEREVDISLIAKLIKKYKTINIYLMEQPTEYLLKQINKINIENGTTIEIIKQGKKAFLEYDVIFFVDSVRNEFPRLRFNKKALIIDNKIANKDKYNSNIIYIESNKKLNANNIHALQQKYGYIKLAQIVKKIVN